MKEVHIGRLLEPTVSDSRRGVLSPPLVPALPCSVAFGSLLGYVLDQIEIGRCTRASKSHLRLNCAEDYPPPSGAHLVKPRNEMLHYG
jgi:hypothetical protein